MNDTRITIPRHIAIIMDGNRRWAQQKGLPSFAGHNFVANKALEPLVDETISQGVKYLTLWAFSTDNWNRSRAEVAALMTIFRGLFRKHIERLHRRGVKLNTIGDLSKFPKDIQNKITDSIEKTKHNTNLTLTFALNYGGRDEIVRAINKLLTTDNPQLTTENDFSRFLDTHDMPDPDLIIRTGGEQRLSGFLLWQSEYAELYFTSVMMPDFTPARLREAIEEYQERERRFGK